MSIIDTSAIDKLSGIAISRRDRHLIWMALGFCAAVIVGLIFVGKDIELHRIAMNAAWWTGTALIIVSVAGTVETRRIAAKALAPTAPKPTLGNTPS